MQDFYCQEIISGKTKVSFIVETEHIIAYHHTQPFWEQHIVVIPKQHIESLTFLSESDREIKHQLLAVVQQMAKLLEDKFGGCRISTNIGSYQSTKHLHFYLHAGKRLRKEDGTPIIQ